MSKVYKWWQYATKWRCSGMLQYNDDNTNSSKSTLSK